MKKKALLIVGLALMVAAAGVVYAHWRDNLDVSVTAKTGTLDVIWQAVWTDDDGADYCGEHGEAGTLEYTAGYSEYGDPSDFNPGNACNLPATARYTKDVGHCLADIPQEGATAGTFTLTLSNVYPSYHCTTWSAMKNEGTVPVKVQRIFHNFPGMSEEEAAIIQAAHDTRVGNSCGQQIDPDENYITVNTIHIPQEAEQGHTYYYEQTIGFVNWNEFDGTCIVCVGYTGDQNVDDATLLEFQGCQAVTSFGG